MNGTIQNDARGSVFQFVDALDHSGIAMNSDGTYKGNVVADMQIMVAKAIEEEVLTDTDALQTVHNTIGSYLIEWAESANKTISPEFCCNGDSMHHVMKGIIVIRVKDTMGFDIRRNTIRHVENLSVAPFSTCTTYHPGTSEENTVERQAGNVRAISVAATRAFDAYHNSIIADNVIRQIESTNGEYVVGIDIQGESQGIEVNRNDVNLKFGLGADVDDMIALRVRSKVDGPSIKIANDNVLAQKLEDLSIRTGLRKRQGFNHPYIPDIEWKNGGCPYARTPGRTIP